MAVALSSRKAEIEQMLEAIATGAPIKPPRVEGWDANALTELAGVSLFARMSHGPYLVNVDEGRERTHERQEAIESQFSVELLHAAWFSQYIAMAVRDGAYDESYEERFSCIVSVHGDDEVAMQPVSGFKNVPEGAMLRCQRMI